jgi:hypothetical protein
MLWNRSLVMIDRETESLWSHLLGEAMQGPLAGTQLEMLPGELVTWGAWRREYPETTVLNLSRTHREFVKEFYRRPDAFVYGWIEGGQAYHLTFASLLEQPIVNCRTPDGALLVTFDPDSTAARLFDRTVNKQTLTFVAIDPGRMQDKQTGTVWNYNTGLALDGPLKGSVLTQDVGIMSFAHAWRQFHPGSRLVSSEPARP